MALPTSMSMPAHFLNRDAASCDELKAPRPQVKKRESRLVRVTKVFVDGASGTTGLEIRERLVSRREIDLVVLDDARRKEAAARADALNSADVVILCLPG